MMKKFDRILKAKIINVAQDIMTNKKDTKFKGSFQGVPLQRPIEKTLMSHFDSPTSDFAPPQSHFARSGEATSQKCYKNQPFLMIMKMHFWSAFVIFAS